MSAGQRSASGRRERCRGPQRAIRGRARESGVHAHSGWTEPEHRRTWGILLVPPRPRGRCSSAARTPAGTRVTELKCRSNRDFRTGPEFGAERGGGVCLQGMTRIDDPALRMLPECLARQRGQVPRPWRADQGSDGMGRAAPASSLRQWTEIHYAGLITDAVVRGFGSVLGGTGQPADESVTALRDPSHRAQVKQSCWREVWRPDRCHRGPAGPWRGTRLRSRVACLRK